jgi:hypothetical protein
MSAAILDQIFELAEQLTPEEKLALAIQLQVPMSEDTDEEVTREQLIAELEQLRAAGAFDNVESLYGKFANPAVDLSQEDLDAYLHEISTAWETEIDEFFGDS